MTLSCICGVAGRTGWWLELRIADVCHWMAANKLELNPDKTELLWAGSKYGPALLGSRGPLLQLREDTITASDHVCLLTVTILSDLSSTCFYWLRQLRRIRQSLNTESVKTLVHPSSHLVLTTVTLCWPGRQSPILTGYSRCWTRQLVSSLAPGSLTVAWRSYVTLSCIGWTFLAVSSISLEWPSTGVFKAGRPSTSWTAAHLLRMSPAISVFALPAATSSSFHDIIAACSAVGHSLLSDRWPGTLSLTISTTQSLVMTSLEQHWRHFFSKYQNM